MKCGYKKSFALPTVLIASVVMMIVLLAAVTATTAMRVSLASKYYNQLASSAAEAGATYAKACLEANNGVALWTDDSPLKPSTDCAGVTLTGVSCPGSSACFLVNDGNVQSSFEVGAPDLSVAGKSNTIRVNGVVNLLRSSTGAVWRTYDQTETITTNYTDDGMPVGTSISGYWSSAPSGYLLEDGSAISRSTYADLFAVIGTTYGSGDGSTTFNLPDSRGRVAVNLTPNDSEFDTMGEKYGEKAHTWTISELPSHTHGQYTGYVDDGNWSGYSIGGQYAPGDAGYWYTPGQTTMSTGGNGSANVIQPSIVKLSAIKYLSTTDSSSSTLSAGTSVDGYWNSKTAPEGYLVEDGSAVSRTTYADLFAAIGTTYGSGDGSTTFNLPDSRGRVGVNISSSDTQFDTMGEKYGEKKHTMTITEMPSHNHGLYIGATDNGDWTGYTVNYQYPPADSGVYSNVGLTTLAAGGGVAANVIQPSIVKLSVVKYTKPSVSSVISSDISVGTSISGWWSSATAPDGYLLEDGSAVSRTTYAELFATIGTTYGSGDGSTTFNLPDSRGRATVNPSSSDTQFATIGAKYGEKTHTMSLAEMPTHSHGIYIGSVDDGNWTSYSIGAQPPPADGPGAYYTGQTTMPTGGGGAYNVVQPSITKLYAIKAVSNISSSHTISALVVAGGGGGGNAGGGGAGGLIYRDSVLLSSGSYSVVVGGGGVGGSSNVVNSVYVTSVYSGNGGNSSFVSLSAIGGGGGGMAGSSGNGNGLAGGSGGGSGSNLNYELWYGGAGTVGQGNSGGNTASVGCSPSGGGGGAGAAGSTNSTSAGGAGGIGLAYSISGTSKYYAGGGGGGAYCVAGAAGGSGGGGAGTQWATGGSGTANTGGGGGGGSTGGAGGSGIVIISYPTGTMSATGGTITTSGGRTIHTFTSSGTFTIL